MKEMIEIIARALVDEPELVSVSEVGGMHASILELTVAKADIGKVIGKQGRTAGALRTLLSAVSAKGSRKNKFTFLGVEAPAWQGAEAQEYRDISALWQHRQAGCIGA